MKQKLRNSKDFLTNGKKGKTIGEKLTDKQGKTEFLTPQQAPDLNRNRNPMWIR